MALKTIVLGYDDTPASRRALERAAHCDVVVVHASPPWTTSS